MKSREISHTDLSVYNKTLSNGLKVYVVPKENCNNIYVTFTTNYGAYQSEFVPYGKEEMIKVPEGVAHFLEHKLFAQKDGVDPFTFYGKSGASSNASTSTFKTTYLFEGINNFEANLNYLLDFVQEPYFTEENVEEEKGIIIQELKMYQDNPFRMGYEKSLYNTFHINPIRYSVGGSVESVSAITKEDLYTCYETFYHPSNMVVVVTGAIDPEETIKIIENNQAKKEFKAIEEIKIKEYDEPNSIFKEKEVLKMNVTLPKVFLNFKIPGDIVPSISILDLIDYVGIFIESNFGTTSEFYNNLIEEKIITDTIDFNIINAKTHIDVMLIAETTHIDEFIKRVIEQINKKEIKVEDFERKKKTMIASLVFMSDNIYRINSKITNNVLLLGDVETDTYEQTKNMKFDTEISILEKIDFNNYATIIIEPKNID